MAVATFTASTWLLGVGPLATGGSNRIHCHLDLSARTLSDIGFLFKLPNQSIVVDYYVKGASGETVSAFKLGIDHGGTETTFGTLSLSTATGAIPMRYATGLPYLVSISDTDAQGGATVYMTISTGSWTTSISLDFMFEYVRRGEILTSAINY